MATRVDLSSIFDNALPMAYVRKVTLSKGSAISNRQEPNQSNQEFKATKIKTLKKILFIKIYL